MSVVTEAIRGLDWHGRQVLVACSGGIDSMVLMHALVREGIRAEVLHVNYGLRGAESDADQQLVESVAKSLGLKFRVHYCPAVLLKGEGINLQAAARNFRRDLFRQWTELSEKHIVALAHHADDQAETFFLQYFRGSGTFGLGAMYPTDGQLWRPLLCCTRADIEAYAKEQHVLWREDRSNASGIYLRNLFRNHLLPDLYEALPRLRESILILTQAFRNRQKELFERVERAAGTWEATGMLSIAVWQEWSEEERIAFVKSAGLPVWTVARITALCAGAVGNRFEVAEKNIWKRDLSSIQATLKTQDSVWEFKIEEVGILPDIFDKQAVFLDRRKLNGELYMRRWKTGDRMHGIGMRGSQLISDLLKEAKVPLAEREQYCVLCDASGILWLPGVKVAARGVAAESGSFVLKVSVLLRTET